jgi:hypothetical protein
VENGRAVSENLQPRQGETLCRKTLIPRPSGCGYQSFLCQMKGKEAGFDFHVKALDFDTQSQGCQESRTGVSERLHHSVCREMLVAWSLGSRLRLFSDQMKAKEVGFLLPPAALHSDTRSLKYGENGRAVSEKLQPRQGETLCRKTLIPRLSGCGYQ